MADCGLAMAQVGLTLQTAFSGNTDAKYRDGDFEYPIRIALDAFDRRSVEDIKSLSFVNPLGSTIYLKQFAEVRLGPGTLYGAITRLEERGWICAVESEDRRRPYRLTGAGRLYLEDQLTGLNRVVKTAMRRLRHA